MDLDASGKPLTKPCSTICGAGVMTCINGYFQQCSAVNPSAEMCVLQIVQLYLSVSNMSLLPTAVMGWTMIVMELWMKDLVNLIAQMELFASVENVCPPSSPLLL